MIPQQIFNTVANHLRTQGRKSIIPNDNTCQYRGPDNTSCAVGCLITDDEYHEDMEGLGIEEMNSRYAIFDESLVPLLNDLQNLHDTSHYQNFRSSMGLRADSGDLTRIADEDYRFNIPVLTQGLIDIAKKYGLEFAS